MTQPPDFDPDAETQARWIGAAADLVRSHLAACAATAAGPAPLPPRPTISESPMPGGIEAALGYVAAAAAEALDTTSPGYMAFIPGGGLLASALADFVADVLNRYTSLAATAPAFVELERGVIAWLAHELGYGASAAGLLTSGGSMATLLAVARARDAQAPGADGLGQLVGYTSSQAHGSIASAFHLAGLGVGRLRRVAVDETFRMRPAALATAIQADRAAGLTPFMAVATAGTTNTGAVDLLPAIADVCARERLWMHVDAAYGGAFMLCPDGRRRLAGVERADSITFDPHKGLFLPYGTGCVLFREDVIPGAHEDEAYLRDARAEGRAVDPADFGLELTRPFRGLRLWLPLVLHGAGAFRAALAQKLDLADQLHAGLQGFARQGRVTMVAAPQLSIVAFARARRAAEDLGSWNARTQALMDAILARGRSLVSSTLLPGEDGDVLAIRACILSHRTQGAHVEALLDDIDSAPE